jgi:GNAT superfamily N-acetyltransferase
MSSLFAQYKKEYSNTDIIETEQGFATFILKPPLVYLEDIFIVPAYRNTNLATHFADSVCAVAKEAGCNVLLGSVELKSNSPDRSIQVLLAYGMKYVSTEGSMLYFKKDI